MKKLLFALQFVRLQLPEDIRASIVLSAHWEGPVIIVRGKRRRNERDMNGSGRCEEWRVRA